MIEATQALHPAELEELAREKAGEILGLPIRTDRKRVKANVLLRVTEAEVADALRKAGSGDAIPAPESIRDLAAKVKFRAGRLVHGELDREERRLQRQAARANLPAFCRR